MKKVNLRRFKKGQIALLGLLVLAVALTIGLSLQTRLTTQLKITTEEEESQKAFSLAESGLQKALVQGPGEFQFEGGQVQTMVATASGATFVFPKTIGAGEIAPLWLVDHDEEGKIDWGSANWNGEIEIYWQNSTQKIEAILISKSGSNWQTTRWLWDQAGEIQGASDPIEGSFELEETEFQLRGNIVPAGKPILLVIRPLDGRTQVGFKGTDNFPSQGRWITSSGKVGETTRTIKLFQGWRLPPIIWFDTLATPNSAQVVTE